MAKSYVQLAQQSVVLLKLFTQAVPRAFVTPELVDRLAAMLDYNLEALVGPKCRELKVKNSEEYGFKPRVVELYGGCLPQSFKTRGIYQGGGQ